MTDSLRLVRHPVLDASFEDRPTVTITVDTKPLDVLEGESLAAALWAEGFISLGHNPSTGSNRGMYCGIGHCYECRVTVDGVEDVRSCLIPVREGMRVTLQKTEIETGTEHDHRSR
jgi:sarcosine oxidase subunit alpha